VTPDAAIAGFQGYVQTRAYSRHGDYEFLGAKPPRQEWLDDFHGVLETTMPCLVLQQTPDGWQLFASEIPSGRQDFHDRPIGYGLILREGPRDGSAATLRDGVYRLIELLLAGIGSAGEFPPLSEAFDEHFSDDAWIARMRKADGPESGQEAREKIRSVLEDLGSQAGTAQAQADAESPGEDRSWLGDAHDRSARGPFLAMVRGLLTGEGRPGDLAVIQNLVSQPGGLPAVPPGTRMAALANLAPDAAGNRQKVKRQLFGEAVSPVNFPEPSPVEGRGELAVPEPATTWWKVIMIRLGRFLGLRRRRSAPSS
jgi:hypothetical protein